MYDFPKRLEYIRKERKLSQQELAEMVQTTKASISRYESGLVVPPFNMVVQLSNCLHVSLEWLSGEGPLNYDNSYEKLIKACKKENISPVKLEKLIDAVKE